MRIDSDSLLHRAIRANDVNHLSPMKYYDVRRLVRIGQAYNFLVAHRLDFPNGPLKEIRLMAASTEVR